MYGRALADQGERTFSLKPGILKPGDLARLAADGPTAGVPEPERLYGAIRAAAPPGPLANDFSVVVIAFD